MKKILISLISLLVAYERVSAELSVENKTSVSTGGGSRTMLEIQLNNLMQDMRPANRDIAALKEYTQKVGDVLKKVDEVKMPEKPTILAELSKALVDLKNLNGDTPLVPTNPAVKTFVDKYRSLQSRSNIPSLPSEVFESLGRSREDPLFVAILDSISRPSVQFEYSTDKIDELIDSLGNFESGKFIPITPPPTRQKVEGQIQAAMTDAATLPKQFEDRFNALKVSTKDFYTKVATALAAEIARRETLLAQQVKSAEEIGKQIAELEKAQSLNVTDLIQKLPILVGILCGLFVGLILLIRFYPTDLQTEWVASGQVIQLLTVVTLLLIILCLAVTHVINENTIGTLLGGIGGYVLSQGVGRAAAREANRMKPPGGGS